MAFRQDIEGLRAVAILLIIGFHGKIPGFSGGFVGVDVFFVLSGYLITSLLVAEWNEQQSIDLFGFYARRLRRLTPALLVMLVVTSLIGMFCFGPIEQRYLANSAITSATYISNIFFSVIAVDYLGASAEQNPFLHTWSLSVEEQFYLFWPWIILFVFRRASLFGRPLGLSKVLIVLCVISFFLSLFLTESRQPLAFFLMPTRLWEFGIGALGCVFVASLSTTTYPMFSSDSSLVRNIEAISVMGLLGIVVSGCLYSSSTIFPGVAVLLPAFSTVLVLIAGAIAVHSHRSCFVGKILSLGIFQAIGRVSYSWYLWHWPFLVYGTIYLGDTLVSRLGAIFCSFLIAHLSYRFIENPIRRNPYFAHSVFRSFSLIAVIAFVCIAGLSGWKHLAGKWVQIPVHQALLLAREDVPEAQLNGCNASYYEVALNLENCRMGSETKSKKIILLGDSHALQWAPAVYAAYENEGYNLEILTKDACPPVNIDFNYYGLKRDYRECGVWRSKALQYIADAAPELVLVVHSYRYPFTEEEWELGLRDVLDKLLNLDLPVVVLRDNPHFDVDIPLFLSRKAWRENQYELGDQLLSASHLVQAPYDVFDIQSKIADSNESLVVVDLNENICEDEFCRLSTAGSLTYRDTNHLTASFARSLSTSLRNRIENAMIDAEREFK